MTARTAPEPKAGRSAKPKNEAPPAAPIIGLADIEKRARAFSERRAKVGRALAAHREQVEKARRRNAPRLMQALQAMNEAKAELAEAVRAAPPALFEKPRTRILHGIKVGWQKSRTKVVFDDAAKVITRIKKKFPDRVASLITTTEAPNKRALEELAPKDRRALGVRIEGGTDEIVVAAVDGDVEQLVAQSPELQPAPAAEAKPAP